MTKFTKVIIGAIVALIVALIVSSAAFSALKHDSDNSDIRPIPPIEATIP